MADVILHPAALREFDAAVEWYQRNGRAAERFVAAVRAALEAIGEQPERFGWYDSEFREAPAGRYPYRIIYRALSPATVQVVAVAHTSREPDYWRNRIGP